MDGGALTGGNGVIVSLILVAAALFLAGGLCAAAAATDAGERHPTVVRVGVWALGSLAGLVSSTSARGPVLLTGWGLTVRENGGGSFFGVWLATVGSA